MRGILWPIIPARSNDAHEFLLSFRGITALTRFGFRPKTGVSFRAACYTGWRLWATHMAATPALRIPARELISREELALFRERVEWKGVALIAHACILIFGSIALVAVFPNPLTY